MSIDYRKLISSIVSITFVQTYSYNNYIFDYNETIDNDTGVHYKKCQIFIHYKVGISAMKYKINYCVTKGLM